MGKNTNYMPTTQKIHNPRQNVATTMDIKLKLGLLVTIWHSKDKVSWMLAILITTVFDLKTITEELKHHHYFFLPVL